MTQLVVAKLYRHADDWKFARLDAPEKRTAAHRLGGRVVERSMDAEVSSELHEAIEVLFGQSPTRQPLGERLVEHVRERLRVELSSNRRRDAQIVRELVDRGPFVERHDALFDQRRERFFESRNQRLALEGNDVVFADRQETAEVVEVGRFRVRQSVIGDKGEVRLCVEREIQLRGR